jgi:hypothetical protein
MERDGGKMEAENGGPMASRLAGEQIQQTIDKVRWKKCPSRF